MADSLGRFPRTLFVIDNLCISGAEKVTVNLLRHAQARGIPAECFVCMDDLVGAQACGVRARTFSGPKGGSFAARVLRGVSRLPALARTARKFDILIPVTPPAIPWAVFAGMLSGVKVIPWIHYDLEGIALEPFASKCGTRDVLMNMLHTKLAPRFDRLLFASRGAMESFARVRGCPKPGWLAVPNVYDPVALTNAQPSACAEALEHCKAKGKTALLFVGRISPQKGWREALKLAEILVAMNFPFELHFAGDGPEMDLLRTAVLNSTAKDAVFLHGFDPNPMPAVASADALVLTSLHEAWPTVILEAFDVGTLVFSLDCPSGPAEMLGRNLERGILCTSTDDMAEKLLWALAATQAELRRKMSINAKRFLNAHFPDNALRLWAEALNEYMEQQDKLRISG